MYLKGYRISLLVGFLIGIPQISVGAVPPLCPSVAKMFVIADSVGSNQGVGGSQNSLSQDLEKVSQKLYREALRLFSQGSYWECARELIILMDFHPGFSQTDGVLLKLGDCLYEMELYEAASGLYSHLIKSYPQSNWVAAALLGLEKVNYKLGKFEEGVGCYEAAAKASGFEEIADEARYFAGQCFYALKNYEAALAVFSTIDSRSSFYDYGLYAQGLCYLKKKSIRQAIECLHRLVVLPIINEERKSIVDDGRLTLGFVYYELGYYQEAIRYFSAVSEAHQSYEQALLGLGWSELKLTHYERAILPLARLVKRSSTSESSEEAFFLLGRCFLKLGMYAEAIKVYQRLIDLFPASYDPSALAEVKKALADEEDRIRKCRVQLLVLESKLLNVIPGLSSNHSPGYIKNQGKDLEELRNELLQKISPERENLDTLSQNLEALRNQIERRQSRRDWRSYAEYGKARALFLQGGK